MPPLAFWPNFLWQAALFLAIAYAAITAVLFALQARLIYLPNLPSREIAATPDRIGLSYETVTITTDDGVDLHGWFVPADRPRGVVLFFHGNAGNISHRLDSLKAFNALGLSTFIFDYRGYGQSGGKPSEDGTYRDAEAAWRYLTRERGVAAQDIVFFGRSLGAAIAAHLAMARPPGALILEGAFTSLPDVGARVYPFLPVRALARFRYDTEAYLKAVAAPLLLIHSPADEVVPIDLGRRLFDSANEPKRFLEIDGSHGGGFYFDGADLTAAIDAFLAEHLAR